MTLHSTVAAPAMHRGRCCGASTSRARATPLTLRPTASSTPSAPAQYPQALCAASRAAQERSGGSQPLSLYVHIPFCESVCYYCACNKVITRHHGRAAEYLDALEREIELHVAGSGAGQPVSQLHFGGGTPTFLRTPS